MARLVDPNEKAPVGPEAQTKEPAAPTPVESIPKEGITAGDLAMQNVPDPQKDPFGYIVFVMEQGFGSVHRRLDQQGKLVADMADKVYGSGKEGGELAKGAPRPSSGPLGELSAIINPETINRALDLAKSALAQANPQDAMALQIGRRVIDGATDTAVRSIFRSVGKEAAGQITHVG